MGSVGGVKVAAKGESELRTPFGICRVTDQPIRYTGPITDEPISERHPEGNRDERRTPGAGRDVVIASFEKRRESAQPEFETGAAVEPDLAGAAVVASATGRRRVIHAQH